MKKISVVFVSVALALLMLGCDKPKKTYWENGNLKSELRYNGDKLNGVCKWYYQNGNVRYSAHYVDNSLEGEFIRWYSNGVVQSVSWYKNNLLDSVCREYSDAGILIEEKWYKQGMLNGSYNQWYESGLPFAEGQYVNDTMNGIWIYLFEEGQIASRAEFDMGTGTQRGYRANGQLNVEIPYKDNVKHGEVKYFDREGRHEKSMFYDYGEFVRQEEYGK